MQLDVLAVSIIGGFKNLEEKALTNINKRWQKVLEIIVENDGDNNMVETCRGDAPATKGEADFRIGMIDNDMGGNVLMQEEATMEGNDKDDDCDEGYFDDDDMVMVEDD